jgi:type II secretory pathway component PulM
MNFDALKEQISDRLSELWNRIQESSMFMNLREKYEALSSRSQKLIVIGSCLCVTIFVFSFPYSYISSSQAHLKSFEETRSIIKDLLKAAKTLKEPSPLPPEVPGSILTGDITHSLDEFRLVPEQLGGVQLLQEKVTNLVPEPVHQIGVTLAIKKLNLRQIVEISNKLQTLGSGVKLMALDILENEASSHYFDVSYRIANFSIPVVVMPVVAPERGKAKKAQQDDE